MSTYLLKYTMSTLSPQTHRTCFLYWFLCHSLQAFKSQVNPFYYCWLKPLDIAISTHASFITSPKVPHTHYPKGKSTDLDFINHKQLVSKLYSLTKNVLGLLLHFFVLVFTILLCAFSDFSNVEDIINQIFLPEQDWWNTEERAIK